EVAAACGGLGAQPDEVPRRFVRLVQAMVAVRLVRRRYRFPVPLVGPPLPGSLRGGRIVSDARVGSARDLLHGATVDDESRLRLSSCAQDAEILRLRQLAWRVEPHDVRIVILDQLNDLADCLAVDVAARFGDELRLLLPPVHAAMQPAVAARIVELPVVA